MRLDINGTVVVPEGDAKIIQFVLEDQDSGDPLEVSTFDINWKLQDTRTREDILSLDDDGISVIFTDDSEGLIQIKLNTNSTNGLKKTDYREVLQITDDSGDRTTWVGDSTFILTEDG